MSQPAAERLARLAAHLEGSSNSTRGSSSLGQQPVASSSGRAAAPSASGSGRGGDAAVWHAQCFNFEPGRLLLDQVAIITGAGGGIGKSVRLALGPVFLCRRKWRPVTALPCPAMHCLRLPLSQVPTPVPPPAAGSHPVCPAGGQGGSQRLGCSKGTGKRLITDATAQPAASVQHFSSRHHCFAAHTMVHTAQPASLSASQPQTAMQVFPKQCSTVPHPTCTFPAGHRRLHSQQLRHRDSSPRRRHRPCIPGARRGGSAGSLWGPAHLGEQCRCAVLQAVVLLPAGVHQLESSRASSES